MRRLFPLVLALVLLVAFGISAEAILEKMAVMMKLSADTPVGDVSPGRRVRIASFDVVNGSGVDIKEVAELRIRVQGIRPREVIQNLVFYGYDAGRVQISMYKQLNSQGVAIFTLDLAVSAWTSRSIDLMADIDPFVVSYEGALAYGRTFSVIVEEVKVIAVSGEEVAVGGLPCQASELTVVPPVGILVGLNASSPSGCFVPAVHTEIFRFDVINCFVRDITIEKMVIRIKVYAKREGAKIKEMMLYKSHDRIHPIGLQAEGENGLFVISTANCIPAKAIHTIVVVADVFGDMIFSVTLEDIEGWTYEQARVEGLPCQGNTLTVGLPPPVAVEQSTWGRVKSLFGHGCLFRVAR